MRISVVIPVYNVEAYLNRCVDSVLRQSYPVYEIILIDDGSTDGSAEICDAYAKAYPDRIRVEHGRNQGASAARNRGIELARGDYLGFVDSDDYIEPDMYGELAAALEKTSADISVGGVWVEEENGEKYSRHELGKDFLWTREEALVELNSFRYFGVSVWDKLYKKELFCDIKFPNVLFEDNFLMYKLIAKCNAVAYVSKPLYHYIQRFGSYTRNQGKVSLVPLEAFRQQLEFFRNEYPQIAYSAEAAYVFEHIAIYNLHVRKGIRCEKSLASMLQREARKYLGSVMKNKRLPGAKRIQTVVFCLSLLIYRFIIKNKSHR